MNAVATEAPQPATAPAKSKMLWISASNTGGGDSPVFVRWSPTQEQLERIKSLEALVEANDLSEARVLMSPDQWGPQVEDGNSFEDDNILTCKEIVCGGTLIWFTCFVDHQDAGHLETSWFTSADLWAAMESDSEHVLLGDTDSLEENIRDCGETLYPEAQ